MLRNVLLVGAGGFLGAVARYGIITEVGRLVHSANFPVVRKVTVRSSLNVLLVGASGSSGVYSSC
jgi:hypothetical protein